MFVHTVYEGVSSQQAGNGLSVGKLEGILGFGRLGSALHSLPDLSPAVASIVEGLVEMLRSLATRSLPHERGLHRAALQRSRIYPSKLGFITFWNAIKMDRQSLIIIKKTTTQMIPPWPSNTFTRIFTIFWKKPRIAHMVL